MEILHWYESTDENNLTSYKITSGIRQTTEDEFIKISLIIRQKPDSTGQIAYRIYFDYRKYSNKNFIETASNYIGKCDYLFEHDTLEKAKTTASEYYCMYIQQFIKYK